MSLSITRRFPVFIGIVILSAIPAVFINSVFGYLPPLMLLAAAGVSAAYLMILKKGIDCTVDSERRTCHRGEASAFQLGMQNSSFLVLTKGRAVIFTEDSSGRDINTIEAVFSIGSENTQKLGFNVTFSHIGVYRAGLRQLDLYDPLGLFICKADTEESGFPVIVLPTTVDISALNLNERNRVETLARPTLTIEGDGMDYSTVREYVTGDPIKQIHWKLSAHMENYVTKVMEYQTNTGVSILLDMTSPEYEPEEILCVSDCIIESGLSIAKYTRKKGVDCELIFLDKTGTTQKIIPNEDSTGEELISRIDKVKADPDSRRGVEMLQWLDRQPYSQTNLIVCTGNPNKDLVQSILQSRQNGKNPEVIIAHPPYSRDRDSRDRPFAGIRSQLEAGQVNSLLLTDVKDFL